MPKSPANVLVVSDLHTGSIYGLAVPGFRLASGARLSLTDGQQWLWDRWVQMGRDVKRAVGQVDAVVVNGDVIDGRQEAQRGTELCAPLLEDQAGLAAAALEHLIRQVGSPKVFGVHGTEYHDQRAGEYADRVFSAVGATPYRGSGTGRCSSDSLNLEAGGKILNFAHGIGVTSGMFRSTALDREALFATLAAREGRAVKADVIVRSHVHTFVHLELPHKHAVITPCWQLQTRFMRSRSVYRMLPDIGAVLLTVSPSAVQVHKLLYPLPPAQPAVLRV